MPRLRCAPLRQAIARCWGHRQHSQRGWVASAGVRLGWRSERKCLVFFLYSVGHRTATSAPGAVR